MDISKRPNRWPWPPIIYALACLTAFALDRLLGWPTLEAMHHLVLRSAGGVLILSGLGLDLWAIVTLARQHTAILPNRSAETLVTHGPFAYSRNPIYVGNTLAMIGIGLALPSVWFLVFAAIAVITVRKLAVEREEAHLASRFGQAWEDYRRRVRRWI